MPHLAARLVLKPAQPRLIHEIAGHGQLPLAADAVGLTQPAASRMLAETERQPRTTPFARHACGMEATESGRLALRHARIIRREMGTLPSELRSRRAGLGGGVPAGRCAIW